MNATDNRKLIQIRSANGLDDVLTELMYHEFSRVSLTEGADEVYALLAEAVKRYREIRDRLEFQQFA